MPASGELSLRQTLRLELTPWPILSRLPDRWFIPQDRLDELITSASILAELKRFEDPVLEPSDQASSKLHERYHAIAKRLFAILVMIGKANDIRGLVKEGLSDERLPLERYATRQPPTPDFIRLRVKPQGSGTAEDRERTEGIKAMMDWETRDFEEFYKLQWSVLAPVFEQKNEPQHYEFHESQILPYTFDAEMGRRLHGVHGDVWKIDIHPGHQRAIPQERAPVHFAIKRHYVKHTFDTEYKVLKALAGKPDSSFIDLYATYEMNSSYHMIFPWASADLLEYWSKVPLPRFSKQNVLWMLGECERIAFGLSSMHNYKDRHQYMSYDRHGPGQDDAMSNVDPDDLLYGRHGDIKPANLLWYCKDPSVENSNGKLVLADFGLSTMNHSNSRSAHPGFQGTISYAPPDVTQGRTMTRAYDIWSLGCVYLEFITWIILGDKGVSDFAEYRFEDTFRKEMGNDTFYTELNNKEAIVRETVGFWIMHLRRQQRCSEMLQEFLDMIESKMLLIEPADRIESKKVHQHLQKLHIQSVEDESYLLDPVKPGKAEDEAYLSIEGSRDRAVARVALSFLDPEKRDSAIEDFIAKDQKILRSSIDTSYEVDLPTRGFEAS